MFLLQAVNVVVGILTSAGEEQLKIQLTYFSPSIVFSINLKNQMVPHQFELHFSLWASYLLVINKFIIGLRKERQVS